MYRYTPFTYLANEKPDLARERMLDAMMEAKGNASKAYVKAGLSSFSWYRYLRILGIQETMASIRESFKNGAAEAGQRYSDSAPEAKAESVFK